MAGTTHYSYSFKSYSGVVWKVMIKDSTYAGATETALIPDNNGFNLSWEGASDVTYQPIISSTFTAGVYRNTNSLALLNAIVTGVENQFYVIVYKATVRQWVGYILQDSLTKPDAANLTDKIMFTATDGFGMLKDIPYTGFDIDNLGSHTVSAWFGMIMPNLPVDHLIVPSYTYTIASEWYEDSIATTPGTSDPLAKTVINEAVFIDVDEYGVAKGMSYYDMFVYILKAFNLQCSQWNGVYLFIQQNTYADEQTRFWTYALAGSQLTYGDLSLHMSIAPTRFAGGTFGFILPVKECSTEYDYRQTIFKDNLLPTITHELTTYNLGLFEADTDISIKGTLNVLATIPASAEDSIETIHKITIRNGSYYLEQITGSLGIYYAWTLTASFFYTNNGGFSVYDNPVDYDFIIPTAVEIYMPGLATSSTVTFTYELIAVNSTHGSTGVDDNSYLVAQIMVSAISPVMEGTQLHKATVSNSAKAILELDNSILGDGPYKYSAGSLFVNPTAPVQSNAWSIFSNYGTASKWSLNTLRCMEMLALRRNTVNTFRSSWNGIPDIHKAINFDSKTWVWTSMSFDCNAEEYSGSLIAIVLDRTGLTPATPIFKPDKTGSSTSGPSTGGGTGAGVTSFNTRTGVVSLSKADVEAVLTGAITSHSHSGAGSGDMLAATYDPIIAGKQVYHGVESYSLLAFTDATKALTLSSITYWYKGTKYISSTTVKCDLDLTADRDNSTNTLTTNKLYFFYFKDATGKLYWSDTAWNFKENVFVATVFWNGANGACQVECHCHSRDLDWHLWAHETVGTRYESGFALTAPTTANDASLSIGIGTIHDEDQEYTTTAQTSMRGWYLVNSTTPTFYNYSTPYLGGASQPQFINTTDYSLANVAASDYICYWMYASLDILYPIYVVPTHATAAFNTLNAARADTRPVLVGINSEMKLLYKFIYKGDGQFQEAVDYRAASPLPGGGVGTIAAAQVSFAPSATISAITVQDAINELDTEKMPANQAVFLGTTSVPITRASGALALAGVSIDGAAGSATGNAATATKLAATKTINGTAFDGSANIDAVPTWKTGITTRDVTTASGTVNVAHGLGRVPKLVKVRAILISSAGVSQLCEGNYDGTNHAGISMIMSEGTTTATSDTVYSSTAFELGFSAATVVNPYTGANRQTATITCDATNIIFTWTKTGTVATAVAQIIWECT